MKKIVILMILSLAISAGIFYINNVIISGWADKLYEIGFMAIPVFIVLALLYYVNKALTRAIRGIRKKPSE